jgi:hypothetical protein
MLHLANTTYRLNIHSLHLLLNFTDTPRLLALASSILARALRSEIGRTNLNQSLTIPES